MMVFSGTGMRVCGLSILNRHRDQRGQFARTFCAKEFDSHGLAVHCATQRVCFLAAHTRRGMHFQRAPHEEVKLVSCGSGAMWDVAVDLRSGSPTFGHWYAAELTPENGRALYIPAGFAHGFQTLEDGTRTRYMMSAYVAPEAAGGLAHDDPNVAIDWPGPPGPMAERDRNWPMLSELAPFG